MDLVSWKLLTYAPGRGGERGKEREPCFMGKTIT